MEYYFLDKEELKKDDSSLSLGWFKIDGMEIVKDKYCMITISLCDLIEGLILLNKKRVKLFKWFPCDSGEVVVLERKEGKVIIKYKSEEIVKNINDFYTEVIKICNDVFFELKKYRYEVVNESAFIDLAQIITSK